GDAGAHAVRDGRGVATAPSAKPDTEEAKPPTGIGKLITRVTRLRIVRAFQHYTSEGGGLLAAGMSYNAIFATFASIWVAFSVAGFIIADNPTLRGALFEAINTQVPGFVGPEGAVNGDDLLSTDALSWTGVIALVGLILTALGFLASMRDSIRRIFDLPPDTTFIVLQKLRDLGLAVGFGFLILLSAVLSVVSNATLEALFGVFGLQESVLAAVAIRIAGYVLVFAVDFVTVAGAYRVLSAIPIPRKRLFAGAAIGAAGVGVLKAAFALGLIGGVGNNPLLAGFAVLIGLLIFFNFLCQVLLIAAAWIAVGMADAHIDARALSPDQRESEEALRLEEARRLVADTNHRLAEEEYRQASGLRKRLLARRIRQDVRAEARRRESVPTASELLELQKAGEAPRLPSRRPTAETAEAEEKSAKS
ncbi:MAG TPA: YhjD/YihY/BrkB family envelope integrity protein, partial [Naasia sp.]